MRLNAIPADIWLLKMTPSLLQRMTPVTATEIYEVGTNNFHRDGSSALRSSGARHGRP
jgi:hypothetical protein